jgi:hypothetical protein
MRRRTQICGGAFNPKKPRVVGFASRHQSIVGLENPQSLRLEKEPKTIHVGTNLVERLFGSV